MAEPRQNRVNPMGEITAISLRGAWTGNRGCLHCGYEILRPWASHHWLVCALDFKGWHQEQWVPGRLTWLFFHDEAVAFAAGHRPCALCRRDAYNRYRDAFSGADFKAGFDEIDRQLHAERLDPRSRQRKLHEVEWPQLPDGTFVRDGDQTAVVSGRELVAWDVTGYGDRRRRPLRGPAHVITPPSTLKVLRAGYAVQINEEAR